MSITCNRVLLDYVQLTKTVFFRNVHLLQHLLNAAEVKNDLEDRSFFDTLLLFNFAAVCDITKV